MQSPRPLKWVMGFELSTDDHFLSSTRISEENNNHQDRGLDRGFEKMTKTKTMMKMKMKRSKCQKERGECLKDRRWERECR